MSDSKGGEWRDFTDPNGLAGEGEIMKKPNSPRPLREDKIGIDSADDVLPQAPTEV